MSVAAHDRDASRDRAPEATHDHAARREPEPERAPALVPETGARGTHDLAALPATAGRAGASLWRGAVVQTKLTVSVPGDPFEREADAVAARVVRGAGARPPRAPEIADRSRLLRSVAPARGPPAATGSAPHGMRSVTTIVAQAGGGRPLDPSVRERIEPHIGMDLGSVRVRDGPDAAAAAHALNARAFTSGSTIYLAASASPTDVGLMAHEATHVVQQTSRPATRTTLMRGLAEALPDISLPDISVTDVIPDAVLDGVRSAVRSIPGWSLLTRIAGLDPLTGEPVPGGRRELIDELLAFGPFAAAAGGVLEAVGVVDRVYDVLAAGLAENGLTLERIQRDIDSAWAQLSLAAGIEGNLAIVQGFVDRLLADVAAFVTAIAARVLEIVREGAIGAAELLLESPVIGPVWSLAKKVLRFDPLRGVPVEAETAEILADFLRLIGEEERLAQMEERGTLQETAAWLDTQLATFAGLAGELIALYADAWAAIQPENLPDLPANLAALAERVFAYLQGVALFAWVVVTKVLELVKHALLGLLTEHAHLVPGFHLLTVIVGQNPFTGETVPRTAENLIRGFVTLIPGGEATYDELAQSGVIADAAGRIEAAITDLGLTPELVVGTFLGIWNALTLDDLLDPLGAIVRVIEAFGEPLLRIVSFVPVVIQVVIELVLRLMNFPSELLGNIIANVGQAIGDIWRDPIGFLMHMVEALKAGFMAFFGNVVVHLTQGLVDWLFRGLGKLGITLPTDFSLASILDLVFQVLGLTAESLWEKLGEHLPAETVAMIRDGLNQLSGAWAFLVDVQDRGLAAIWELVTSQLGSLWQTLLGVAMEWVMTQIITSGVVKLLSFLDPTFIMSIINGAIAFFNAVQAAIEYLHDMLEILNLYVGTFAAIAAGNIEPGAQMIEQGLAAVVPVAIGFLAYLLGIDDVPYRIAQIIQGVRDAIDRALDWLIEQAIRLGSGALAALRGGATPAGQAASQPEESLEEREWIHEHPEGGHMIRVAPDLSVFRFSDPVVLTGPAALAVHQGLLETLVPPVEPTYPLESPPGRAQGASGFIAVVKENEARAGLPPVKNLPGGIAAYEPGDVRGHLIGDRFHGKPVHANLVPMHPTLNGSRFLSFETRLANAYKAEKKAGHAVLLRMAITPRYSANDPAAPGPTFRPSTLHASCSVYTLVVQGTTAAAREQAFNDDFTNPSDTVLEIDLNTATEDELLAMYRGALSSDVHLFVDAILATRPFKDHIDIEWGLTDVLPQSKVEEFQKMIDSRVLRFRLS